MPGLNSAASSAEPHQIHHASFVLRCWRDREGGIRLRLIDARSGVSYPLVQLSELPGLLQGLMERVTGVTGEAGEVEPDKDQG